MTSEHLMNELRHNQSMTVEAADHEGGKWMLSYKAAEPGSDEPDTVEYTDPDGTEDEVEAETFVSLHVQYDWTIEAVR